MKEKKKVLFITALILMIISGFQVRSTVPVYGAAQIQIENPENSRENAADSDTAKNAEVDEGNSNVKTGDITPVLGMLGLAVFSLLFGIEEILRRLKF